MHYATFLTLFLGVPLVGLIIVLRRQLLDRRFLALEAALVMLALAFMIPWDHLAATWHLWVWTPGRIWGWRLFEIPLEEILYCILQTLLTGALTYALVLAVQRRRTAQPLPSPDAAQSTGMRRTS